MDNFISTNGRLCYETDKVELPVFMLNRRLRWGFPFPVAREIGITLTLVLPP